jgi:hypothetical protein
MPEPVAWVEGDLTPQPPEPWCQAWGAEGFICFVACHEKRTGVFVLDEVPPAETTKMLFAAGGLSYRAPESAIAELHGGDERAPAVDVEATEATDA